MTKAQVRGAHLSQPGYLASAQVAQREIQHSRGSRAGAWTPALRSPLSLIVHVQIICRKYLRLGVACPAFLTAQPPTAAVRGDTDEF